MLIGLFICYGVVRSIQSSQGENRHLVCGQPTPFTFWKPSVYEVLQVPDFLLVYLVLGVALSTAGFMMLLYLFGILNSNQCIKAIGRPRSLRFYNFSCVWSNFNANIEPSLSSPPSGHTIILYQNNLSSTTSRRSHRATDGDLKCVRVCGLNFFETHIPCTSTLSQRATRFDSRETRN